MSFTPIKGTDGTVKIGAALSAVSIARCRSWSFKGDRSTEKLPPHIGDPDEVEVVTGKNGTLDMEFTIPSGRDDGQQDIIDAYEGGANDRLEMVQNGGYTLTFSAPAYKSLEITNDAKGTPVMKVQVSGAYTLAPSGA